MNTTTKIEKVNMDPESMGYENVSYDYFANYGDSETWNVFSDDDYIGEMYKSSDGEIEYSIYPFHPSN